MSAAEAIMAARAAGVSLEIDGDDLVLEAPRLRQTQSLTYCRAISPTSWRCCGPGETAGWPRIGSHSSMGGSRSPS